MQTKKTFSCEDAELQLLLQHSHELDDASDLELHLKTCSNCQNTQSSFDKIHRMDQLIAPQVTKLPTIKSSTRIHLYLAAALLFISIGVVSFTSRINNNQSSTNPEYTLVSDFDPFQPIQLTIHKKRSSLTGLSDELSRFERRLDSIQPLNIYKGPSRAKK